MNRPRGGIEMAMKAFRTEPARDHVSGQVLFRNFSDLSLEMSFMLKIVSLGNWAALAEDQVEIGF